MWVYNRWKTGTLAHCPIVTIVHVMESKWQNETQNHYTPYHNYIQFEKKIGDVAPKTFHIQLFRNDAVDIVHVCEFNDSIVNVCFACISFRILVDLTLIISVLWSNFMFGCNLFEILPPIRFLRFPFGLASFFFFVCSQILLTFVFTFPPFSSVFSSLWFLSLRPAFSFSYARSVFSPL